MPHSQISIVCDAAPIRRLQRFRILLTPCPAALHENWEDFITTREKAGAQSPAWWTWVTQARAGPSPHPLFRVRQKKAGPDAARALRPPPKAQVPAEVKCLKKMFK